jgi:formamidopyrimidine-DNA glycosylase
MPELPEVETVKRQLKKTVLNKKVKDIWSDHPKMVSNLAFDEFKKEIKNKTIQDVARRGKNIFIELSENKTIWVHLKMTGHLLFKPNKLSKEAKKAFLDDKFNQYIHFIFYFNDGSTLEFSDLRKFGKIKLFKAKIKEILKDLKRFGLDQLGVEPLAKEFSLKKFLELFSKVNQPVKVALMDQKKIVGIGNIYASEILFDAGIKPERSVDKLKKSELKKIYLSIIKILKKAVKNKGTSTSDFRDVSGLKGNFERYLKVYGRSGKKCTKCDRMIQRIKQAQRSTFFCPVCQE